MLFEIGSLLLDVVIFLIIAYLIANLCFNISPGNNNKNNVVYLHTKKSPFRKTEILHNREDYFDEYFKGDTQSNVVYIAKK